MDIKAGTKFGPYEIVSPIAVGGMGEVYRAYDTRLGRTVAVKVLSAHLSDDAALKKRFQREARAISLLNHPNICALYDVGEECGKAFLVMEYLDGETLAERLARGAMPLGEALGCAVQIAAALERAHREGIVHRDLKPGNVILTRSGAKLLDFGLARLTAEAETSAGPLTADDALIGTVDYMSPEQLNGSTVDHRSDIFSFGVLLYEMVTGQRPFTGHNRASVIGAILFGTSIPPSETGAEVDPAVDRLIANCLQKNAEERIQTAHDLRLQLEWLRDGNAGAPPRSRTIRLSPATRTLMGVAIVAVLIASALFGLRSVWQPARKPWHADLVSHVPGEQIGWPVISPDGSRVAFISVAADGRRALWIRDLRTGANSRVQSSDAGFEPFWSADGETIGFFAADKMQVVSAAGGEPQPVAVATAPRGASWSRQGTIVYAPHVSSELWSTTAAGAAPVRVTQLDEAQRDVSHRWPEFLPDGKHFLFVVMSRMLQRSGLYVGELGNFRIRKIAPLLSRVVVTTDGWMLFVRDRRLQRQRLDLERLELVGTPRQVADEMNADLRLTGATMISVSRQGTLLWLSPPDERNEIGWGDRNGKWLQTILPAGQYVNPALSPDGAQLAVSRIDEESGRNSIWICDLKSGRFTPFVDDDANADGPVWSEDGSSIYFSSDRRGSYEVWQRAVRGVAPLRLVVPTRNYAQAIASTERGTLFHVTGSGSNAAGQFLFEPKGTAALQPVGGFVMGACDLSRDGQWLLGLNVNSESTSHDIVIESRIDPTRRLKLATDGGAQPLWRSDGREFYYVRRDAMLIATPFHDGELGESHPLFPLDVRDIFYASHDFDVAPDGQRFIITRRISTAQNAAHLIVNWGS